MHCDEHPGAILLVDDDDCIRKSVKQCLERAGYTVIVASDGDRVLELDGALPVLFMSGSVNADRGNGCLAKPFRRSELIAKLDL